MVRVDLNQLSQIGTGTKGSVKRTDSRTDRTDFSDLLHDRVSEDREAASQKTEELQDKKPVSSDKRPADDKGNKPVDGKDERPAEGTVGQPSEEVQQEVLPELLVQFQNSIQYSGMMGQRQALDLVQDAGQTQPVQNSGMQTLNETEIQNSLSADLGQPLEELSQNMEQMLTMTADGLTAEHGAENALESNPDGRQFSETGGKLSEESLAKETSLEGLLKEPAKATEGEQLSDNQNGLAGESAQAEGTMYQTITKPQGMDSLFKQMNVKSAMNPETVPTSPETFGPDVGKALAAKIPEQNGTLTIELEPASLGKLTIHVVYESDKATVSILTSNPKTLELLNQNAVEIAHIMEEKTGQQTMIYVPESQEQMDARTDGQGHKEQDRDQEEPKHRDQSDAFAQRLRLGLV